MSMSMYINMYTQYISYISQQINISNSIKESLRYFVASYYIFLFAFYLFLSYRTFEYYNSTFTREFSISEIVCEIIIIILIIVSLLISQILNIYSFHLITKSTGNNIPDQLSNIMIYQLTSFLLIIFGLIIIPIIYLIINLYKKKENKMTNIKNNFSQDLINKFANLLNIKIGNNSNNSNNSIHLNNKYLLPPTNIQNKNNPPIPYYPILQEKKKIVF